MGLQVLKFGGTSLGSISRIEHVAEIVKKRAQQNQVVVVCSAMAGETDSLVAMSRQFTNQPLSREVDVLLSSGEQKTIALLSICLAAKGVKARSFLADQIRIETDEDHTRARIQKIDTPKIYGALNEGSVVVVPGFQGVTSSGEITTLGRGGSDTSAVALAAALNAELCDIFTDVEGVFTTDPNVVPEARKLNCITYDEMLELASLGAKVLQTRSVEFAKKFDVVLRVRSSFKDVSGTWVKKENTMMESLVVSGITYTKNEAKVVLLSMPDRVGLAADLFSYLGEQGFNVDVIVQNISHSGTTDISFTVPRDELHGALELLESKKTELGFKKVVGDPHISKVSVIGNGMRSHSGVAGKVFRALSDADVGIQMISTSEIKISCVVDEAKAHDAVRALHKAFGLEKLEPQELEPAKSQ